MKPHKKGKESREGLTLTNSLNHQAKVICSLYKIKVWLVILLICGEKIKVKERKGGIPGSENFPGKFEIRESLLTLLLHYFEAEKQEIGNIILFMNSKGGNLPTGHVRLDLHEHEALPDGEEHRRGPHGRQERQQGQIPQPKRYLQCSEIQDGHERGGQRQRQGKRRQRRRTRGTPPNPCYGGNKTRKKE